MSLTLHYHPLASFPWKVLIALYENGTPFERVIVNLGDRDSGGAFRALWAMGKMPVLVDSARGETLPETSVIIEYLSLHYSGRVPLVPTDPEEALEVRLWDRIFDLYVQQPMQKIVGDRLRPGGRADPEGVEQARSTLRTAYAMVEARMAERSWACGEGFSMADCAAAPGLFYAAKVEPYAEAYPALAAYFGRLSERPSFQQVVAEAEPYFHMFPA
jgi:glutathione S-transferase